MDKPTDSLARDVMLAKQAGMSYGQRKARQPIVPIAKREIPDGWRACEFCGKPFKPTQGKRFCDIWCRTEAYRDKAREIQREYDKKRKRKKVHDNENESCG